MHNESMDLLPFLDVRTVMIGFTLTNSIVTVLLGLFWRRNRTVFQGIRQWFWSFVFMTSGYALLLLQGVAPEIISIVFANALTMYGLSMMLRGLRAFFGLKRQRLVHSLVLAAYVASILYTTYVEPNLVARMLSTTLTMLFYIAACSLVAFGKKARSVLNRTSSLALIFALGTISLVARAVLILVRHYDASTSFITLGGEQALLLLIFQMINVGIIYALILVVTQRKSEELAAKERALAESQRIMDIRIRLLKASASASSTQLSTLALNEAKAHCPSESGAFTLIEDYLEHTSRQDGDEAFEACIATSKPLAKSGSKQEAVVPVLRSGQVVGLMGLWRSVPHYSESELSALESIADLAYDIIVKKRSDEAIDLERNNLRKTFDALPSGMLLLDAELMVWKANEAALRLLSLSMAECLHQPYEKLFKPVERHRTAITDLIAATAEEGHRYGFIEIESLRAPVREGRTWFRIGAERLELDGEEYYILVFSDVSENHLAQERMEKALEEKESLIRELYHRGNNTMSLIDALLEMQAEQIEEPNAREAIKATQNRIQAMALVNSKLFEAKDLSRLDLVSYLMDLVELARSGHGKVASVAKLESSQASVPVLFDTAIPCGLIVTELVGNSLKHARPPNGRVELGIRIEDHQAEGISLEISDNGVVDEGFDPRRQAGQGLRIVIKLVEEQLKGQIRFDTSQGFSCRIHFKRDLYAPRV